MYPEAVSSQLDLMLEVATETAMQQAYAVEKKGGTPSPVLCDDGCSAASSQQPAASKLCFAGWTAQYQCRQRFDNRQGAGVFITLYRAMLVLLFVMG
ncbi:MAG: hypothetical protein OIF57_16300 [Marinobacterium sp.]|nr:hypothetical protein [Marinobacterium sp.]